MYKYKKANKTPRTLKKFLLKFQIGLPNLFLFPILSILTNLNKTKDGKKNKHEYVRKHVVIIHLKYRDLIKKKMVERLTNYTY